MAYEVIYDSEIEKGAPLDALTLTKIKNNLDYVKNNLGSGGGALEFLYDIPNAATQTLAEGLSVFEFQAGLGQKIKTVLGVPSAFISGVVPKIKVRLFTAESNIALTMNFVASVTVIPSSQAVSNVTYTQSFNSSVQVPSTSKGQVTLEINLADSLGKINAQTISAGDMLIVELSRGTDTNTSVVHLVPSLTEVKFTA